MCYFLSKLSDIPESGVDISEAEKVLETMPLMQNSRDIEAMYIYRNNPEKLKLAAAVGKSVYDQMERMMKNGTEK